MSDYTVNLEQLFRGPADLLLQLVKDEELNVQELSVAKICEGFLKHFKDLPKSDLEDAADFLVIAATLMWLKSNAILPHEAVDLEEDLLPKDDLLTRLLEYRKFRSAAQGLSIRAEDRANRFERGGREESESEEPAEELADLSSWDLLEVFARLMKETLFDRPHAVKGDGKPIREYAKEILQKLKESKSLSFSKLFNEIKGRDAVIGCFLALLELAKQGVIGVDQKDAMGEIELVLKDESLASLNLDLFGSVDSVETKSGESSNV